MWAIPIWCFGIPLYSDLAHRHDFVVQARHAFDQTIRGITNLGRVGVPAEIRVVIHRHTYERLPHLAQFIGRNLPFVSHVALMGLEHMGYTKMNREALWIDPLDYQSELAEAVDTLSSERIRTSIYNHQLCTLPDRLWSYAVRSISDWKNDFLEVCERCEVQEACAGFFSSGLKYPSRGIVPVRMAADDPRAAGLAR